MSRQRNFSLGLILIGVIGFLMVLASVVQLSLGMFGELTIGRVTEYRRVMGERNESIPNRYTYSLGYEYWVSDKSYHGSSTVIGSSVFVKPDGGQPIPIKYFSFLPSISAPINDTNLDVGKVVMVGLGSLLLWVMVKKSK